MDTIHFTIGMGLLYNGDIYTVKSLVQEKIGATKPTLKLGLEASGLEIILEKSCNALEWQRWVLGSITQSISAYQRDMVSVLTAEYMTDLDLDDVERFASEILKLQRVFYEDSRGEKVPDRIKAEHERFVRDFLKSCNTSDEITEHPGKLLYMPFVTEEADEYTVSRIVKERHDAHVHKAISNRARICARACTQGRSYNYPTLDSNLLQEFLMTYLKIRKGLIFFQSDFTASVMVEGKDPKNGIAITTEDGRTEHYRQILNFSDFSFANTFTRFVESAAINSIRPFKVNGININGYNQLFPMSLENGEITLISATKKYEELRGIAHKEATKKPNTAQEGKGERFLRAVLDFPAYSMIDIHSPDNVFLMEPGTAVFNLHLRLDGRSRLLSYKVCCKDDPDRQYYHFFVSSGHVCGFRSVDGYVEGDSSETILYVPFSQVVWENYQKLLAVLTDGLKSDSGYKHIDSVKRELSGEKIEINGHEFPSRYLPRSEIDKFNQTHKRQIHIGDGRIR